MRDQSWGVSQSQGRRPLLSQREGVGNVEILDIIKGTTCQKELGLAKTVNKYSQLKANWQKKKRVMCT